MHDPLRIHQITKSFADHQVLQGVSLTLKPGEMFGLIGLNGAGKTTLIKIILDLLRADEGEVSILGVSASQEQARRALAYLPEKFQPSRYLTGYEYLTLALDYYGAALQRDAAADMAVALDLDPAALARRVRSYSKGMGQKLGLMGAMMMDVPLFILDEPMSGLDPRARICLKQQLLRLKREGRTVFFSSHILADIDEICDRIAVMHQGVLRYVGTPAEFKQRFGGSATLEQCFLNSITQAA